LKYHSQGKASVFFSCASDVIPASNPRRCGFAAERSSSRESKGCLQEIRLNRSLLFNFYPLISCYSSSFMARTPKGCGKRIFTRRRGDSDPERSRRGTPEGLQPLWGVNEVSDRFYPALIAASRYHFIDKSRRNFGSYCLPN